jgi:membrane-bound lytic murein transglycosylase D
MSTLPGTFRPLLALGLLLGPGCATLFSRHPGPPPATPVVPSPSPSPPAAEADRPLIPPPPATPVRPPRQPRGEVAEVDKPEWMRGLARPELPLRWYPRVSQYLEQYRNEPRAKEIVRGWLRRMEAHRPTIEAALARERLPKGLIFVAMIESGFSPGVVSPKGAGGFWQFIPEVGRSYGLDVSFWVDERRDLERSSMAAARFLGDLYRRFGTWELALAAYNAGPYAVADAIVRYNTNDYFTLCQVEAGLPFETTQYVPKILAVGIVAQNPAAFGIEPGEGLHLPEAEAVTVPPATTFDAIAARLGVRVETLAELNPTLVRRRTPPERASLVRLPPGKAVLVGRAFGGGRPADVVPTMVRPGETLLRIAKARRLPISRLRRLNGVNDDAEVTVGTTILVPAPPRRPSRPAGKG